MFTLTVKVEEPVLPGRRNEASEIAQGEVALVPMVGYQCAKLSASAAAASFDREELRPMSALLIFEVRGGAACFARPTASARDR